MEPVVEERKHNERKDFSAFLKPGETTVKDHPDLKFVSHGTLKKRAHDQKERESKRDTVHDFNSSHELAKKDALEILGQRIHNPHVRETAYELGKIAAEHHNIPTNEFYWKHGLTCILRSRHAAEGSPETLLVPQPKKEVSGEVIYYDDLYAVYDYGMSWREQISFEEFLVLRYVCKTDAFQLGLTLGKDCHEYPDGPHGLWREFFPKFKPTLKPSYNQEQMKEWLAAQDPVKDRLLLASRNSYKSSWDIVWLLTAVLNCPDIRLLIVSETNKLSKGFIKGFR